MSVYSLRSCISLHFHGNIETYWHDRHMVPRPVLTQLLLQRFILHVTIKKNWGTNSKTKHSTSARCMHSLSDLSVLVTPLGHTRTHSRSELFGKDISRVCATHSASIANQVSPETATRTPWEGSLPIATLVLTVERTLRPMTRDQ